MCGRLLEELGADRRVVVRPNIGDTSALTMLVDRDHVVHVRELTGGAVVLAGATGRSVQLDELHVEGLHGGKHTTGVA